VNFTYPQANAFFNSSRDTPVGTVTINPSAELVLYEIFKCYYFDLISFFRYAFKNTQHQPHHFAVPLILYGNMNVEPPQLNGSCMGNGVTLLISMHSLKFFDNVCLFFTTSWWRRNCWEYNDH
jgi:hypothetical protein